MDERALRLLATRPAKVARLCGLDRLTDELHGPWLKEIITGREDYTLLAHRGSYKTSCLAMGIAALMILRPGQNYLVLRKTDDDVVEIIRLVRQILESDAMRCLSSRIYGEPVTLIRADMHALTASCYAARRGAPQLSGQGIGGAITGKHADVVFTDDIVNLQDRLSPVERRRSRDIYRELQNIKNPGGRIVNAGTPWHPDDAIALMPRVHRWDCYATGLLTPGQLEKLRQVMPPSLFAANYELKHIAREGALLDAPPAFTDDEARLHDGVAHIDAAYGGGDYTALTLGRRDGDQVTLYGRLWRGHVDDVIDDILAECDRLRCGPILLETNADKGYLARELRLRGAMVRPYYERMPKAVKIGSYLRKWWPRVRFLSGTDPEYLAQVMDYGEDAAHDDAPDSAACVLRALEGRPSRGGLPS